MSRIDRAGGRRTSHPTIRSKTNQVPLETKPDTTVRQFTFRMTEDMLFFLQEVCDEKGMSINTFLQELVRSYAHERNREVQRLPRKYKSRRVPSNQYFDD